MIKKFTTRTVESLKPVPGKRLEIHDSEATGLTLRIASSGAKSWCVLYRHRGRSRRLTLGPVDAIPLAEARDRARDAVRDASKGEDPAETKRAARKAKTIAELVTDYIERYAKKRKRSWREDDRILRAEVLPRWKHRAIEDIKRRDVRLLVEAIADRGAPIMANRTTALLSKVFRFALDDELIENSPAVRISRPAPESRRDRVLTEHELRTLWTAWDAGAPEMAAFFKLRLITAQRGGEVAAMRWSDVDMEAGWWTIPAGVAKNKLAHRVPLSSMALDIIRALPRPADAEEAEGRKAYVVTGARGRRQRTEAAKAFGVSDFRGHDLRRTAASMMASGGIARLVISKILNHVEPGVTAVYDRHSYDPEKRAALDWWARKLNAILESHDAGAKVLPFAVAR